MSGLVPSGKDGDAFEAFNSFLLRSLLACATCHGNEEIEQPTSRDEFGVYDTVMVPCPDCTEAPDVP
jgi:hypothetical protein